MATTVRSNPELMSRHIIPEISETERWVARTTIKGGGGRDAEIGLADAEVGISPADRELTTCPVILSQSDDGCTFATLKVGERNYRCQVFYTPYRKRAPTGADCDELGECTVPVLQARASYATEQRGDLPSR